MSQQQRLYWSGKSQRGWVRLDDAAVRLRKPPTLSFLTPGCSLYFSRAAGGRIIEDGAAAPRSLTPEESREIITVLECLVAGVEDALDGNITLAVVFDKR